MENYISIYTLQLIHVKWSTKNWTSCILRVVAASLCCHHFVKHHRGSSPSGFCAAEELTDTMATFIHFTVWLKVHLSPFVYITWLKVLHVAKSLCLCWVYFCLCPSDCRDEQLHLWPRLGLSIEQPKVYSFPVKVQVGELWPIA